MRACHLHTRKEAKNWDFDALTGVGAFRSTADDMLRYLKANMGVDGSPLTAAFVGSQCPPSARLARCVHRREGPVTERTAGFQPLRREQVFMLQAMPSCGCCMAIGGSAAGLTTS
jgi:hypothetical protein